MKKLISCILTYILIFSSVSVIRANAISYGKKNAESFYYEVIENKYASVTGVKENYFDEVIEIPSEIDGYTVKYIDDYFPTGFDADDVKTIIIPDTVTYIKVVQH